MSSRDDSGRTIRSTLPFIRKEIPIAVVFRALGVVSDRDILDFIVYDLNDTEMVNMLRPSLEEAFPIRHQHIALDYIGKRGTPNLFSCYTRKN